MTMFRRLFDSLRRARVVLAVRRWRPPPGVEFYLCLDLLPRELVVRLDAGDIFARVELPMHLPPGEIRTHLDGAVAAMAGFRDEIRDDMPPSLRLAGEVFDAAMAELRAARHVLPFGDAAKGGG